ncbi:MAG: 3-dehydroquinate synthase [Clostridia bacterium]|nr:3-dehydroquinate synthase [Clostridia bacterium]
MSEECIRIGTAVPYDVRIGPGLLDRAGEALSALHRPCRTAVITDDTVAALYGKRVTESLAAAGFGPMLWAFPHGERYKTMATLTEALNWLAGSGLSRGDLIVALGGGVPGDLAGFAAAVYCRGTDFMQIPTTLLAAVDSSVGGKTAVDLPAGKNMAGAFHQPRAVLCDTDVLRDLPEDLVRDGSAEMLKYGMLCDAELFARMADGSWREDIGGTVARCVAIKRDYVLQDETDRGARQFLNLGHTFGHAAEKCSGFTLTHGQGVGMGLMMASRAAGIDTEPVRRALQACRLEADVPFAPEELAAAALSDKKRQGGRITLVLPERIGACRLETVDVSALPDWFRRGAGCPSDKGA